MAHTSHALALVALAAAVAAAEGPENAILVVDPTSHDAMYVANYYKAARGLPDANVLYMAPGAANLAAFAGANRDGLLGALANRRLDDHADLVILPPGPFYVSAPGLISDGCSPVNRLSITSAYATAFFTDLILDGTANNLPNGYFSANGAPLAFDSNETWFGGNHSDADIAKRYFIGAMLGETGENGNTIDEILDMIDRSVAADGTRPEGTYYFMNNTADPARNVRNTQFPSTIAAMTDAGHDAEQIDAAKLPIGKQDCLGVLSGFANGNIVGADYALIPGAFADHLTSYAATLDNGSQSKVSEWIRKGASASAGAVEEPCNYTGKFTFARFHYYYAEGLSIGEAYLRTIAWGPFQNLLYGDPLTRAHTYIPDVDLGDLPPGPLAGVVAFTPGATTPDPDAAIESITLYVDGVPDQTVAPGEQIVLDTTALDDGYHELRVVASDDTTVRARGNAVADVEIDNAGGAVDLGVNMDSGLLHNAFVFTVDGFGARDVDRVRLLQHGRVVATAPADAGSATLTVHGIILGAGPSRLRAEAVLADDAIVRSNPVDIEIGDFFEQVAYPVPVAFDHEIRVLDDQPFLVELPATYRDDPATATYEIVDAPGHATVYDNDGPFRVLIPNGDGADADSFTFRVTTPNGTSNVATVDIAYAAEGCPADVNGDGLLNILDFVAFQTLFQAGDPAADVNGDGALNILDFVAYQQLFQAGCP